MKSSKASIYGNPYLGVYGIANDKICLVAKHTPEEIIKKIKETLEVEVYTISIGGSGLLGIYTVMNSNGIVVPSLIFNEELEELKKLNLNIYVTENKFNAVGNNIAVNDFGGVIDEETPEDEIQKISECLKVELVPMKLKEYRVMGSLCAVTNKGFAVYNDISERKFKELEKIFKVSGINTTANTGSYFVGLCMIANSNGCVVGDLTTGYELQRIQEGLELI